jgi:hypothetical protein
MSKMYLDAYKNNLTLLCRQNNVKLLYVFASVLTNSFEESVIQNQETATLFFLG